MDQVDADAPIRIARPVADLAVAERFWVDGVGLEVLFRSGPEPEGGHPLLMVGRPGAGWHLELVGSVQAAAQADPQSEELLVVYLNGEPDPDWLVRIEACGGRRVVAANPYWERWGRTYEDPDGYRLVLSTRDWAP